MGRSRILITEPKSQTHPSSPSLSSSSSSSDFEFTISVSPRKSSPNLCPADDLFYKGQLLPLHLSPRLSMVRTILLSSSSTSSSSADSTTVASRDSTGSSNDSSTGSSFTSDLALIGDCDSSRRPSSADYEEDPNYHHHHHHYSSLVNNSSKKPNYFSLSRFSSVFRKDPKPIHSKPVNPVPGSGKRMSVTAKDVIRKYLRKVKPLYEKLSQKQQQKIGTTPSSAPATNFSFPLKNDRSTTSTNSTKEGGGDGAANRNGISHSFSGNLRLYPKRRRNSCVSSCPSSMRSSPSHSGILCRNGMSGGGIRRHGESSSSSSSMEELQSAIQGAIAHCKNSMIQSN